MQVVQKLAAERDSRVAILQVLKHEEVDLDHMLRGYHLKLVDVSKVLNLKLPRLIHNLLTYLALANQVLRQEYMIGDLTKVFIFLLKTSLELA